MEQFEIREQYQAMVHFTYLDDSRSSRGAKYTGGIFTKYPTQEEIREVAKKFLNYKEKGELVAESIDYIIIEKRHCIYTESLIELLNGLE